MSLVLGGAGAFTGNDARTTIQGIVDNLDEVLQREIILRIEPLVVRIAELGDDQDNMRDRINMLESEISLIQGQFEEYRRTHP